MIGGAFHLITDGVLDLLTGLFLFTGGAFNLLTDGVLNRLTGFVTY